MSFITIKDFPGQLPPDVYKAIFGGNGDDDSGQKTPSAGKAGEIGRWNGHIFKVDKKSIRGFKDLQIKGATETEDKVGGNQKFVSRKNSKPTEISLTAILSKQFGCDVQKEAMQFVADAYNGCNDWFYVGKSKLATYKLMLTDANVKDIVITPKGKWLSCSVALTLKQCTQKNGSTAGVVDKGSSGDSDGGGGGGSGGGSGGGGSKKKSTKKKGWFTKTKEGTTGDKKKETGDKAKEWVDQHSKKETTRTAQDEIDKRKEQAQKARQAGAAALK